MDANAKALQLVLDWERNGGGADALALDVAQALAEFTIHERTACARICDGVGKNKAMKPAASVCATAIRARG